MALVNSFPPLARHDARVLILGSMPGVASLTAGQYYAHPRNLFWTFMGEMLGAGPELPYDIRTQRLMEAGIALWDVLAACERPGSLDGRIRMGSEVANDIASLLRDCPHVHTVFLNGRKAETAFRRYVQAQACEVRPALRVVAVPSTSPANQSVPLGVRRDAWRQVSSALGTTGG